MLMIATDLEHVMCAAFKPGDVIDERREAVWRSMGYGPDGRPDAASEGREPVNR
jgi:hypothetical protein